MVFLLQIFIYRFQLITVRDTTQTFNIIYICISHPLHCHNVITLTRAHTLTHSMMSLTNTIYICLLLFKMFSLPQYLCLPLTHSHTHVHSVVSKLYSTVQLFAEVLPLQIYLTDVITLIDYFQCTQRH